jgi:hypothetical protein
MSKAHLTTAVVGLVALLSAGVLATSPMDGAQAAAVGVSAPALCDDAHSARPTKGTRQWNS